MPTIIEVTDFALPELDVFARLTEALLTAIAMALGAGLALSIMHMAGGG